jgi:hypothetical protein
MIICVIIQANLLEFLGDGSWDDTFVMDVTQHEWIRTIVSNNSDTNDGGAITNKYRHLYLGDPADEVFIQLSLERSFYRDVYPAQSCVSSICFLSMVELASVW